MKENKNFKFGDCVVWDNCEEIIKGIINSQVKNNQEYFEIFDPFSKEHKFLNNSCWIGYLRHANAKETYEILEKAKEEKYNVNFEDKKIIRKRWRALKGEIYYHINSEGTIFSIKEQNNKIDDLYYECGNYFKTEEQAEKVNNRINEIYEEHKNDFE